MAYFRKKPVAIEAIRWYGSGGISKLWADCDCSVAPGEGQALIINTLEGVMTAQIGDWIIKGVKGEFYPCKNDIFRMTYDKLQYEDDLPEGMSDPDYDKWLQESSIVDGVRMGPVFMGVCNWINIDEEEAYRRRESQKRFQEEQRDAMDSFGETKGETSGTR